MSIRLRPYALCPLPSACMRMKCGNRTSNMRTSNSKEEDTRLAQRVTCMLCIVGIRNTHVYQCTWYRWHNPHKCISNTSHRAPSCSPQQRIASFTPSPQLIVYTAFFLGPCSWAKEAKRKTSESTKIYSAWRGVLHSPSLSYEVQR